MKEEQFKVLKTLSEITSRIDLGMFAQKVNLTSDQTINQIQELTKEGFLQKVGGGFGITAKGKAALKVFTPVPKDMIFHFYYGVDKPSELTADSLEQFYMAIKQIGVESVEFHLYRGDFGKWLEGVCKEPELASGFEQVQCAGLRGEELRAELLKEIDEKFDVEGLVNH